jgi:cytochrome subunit of sulfide dehydrogenase
MTSTDPPEQHPKEAPLRTIHATLALAVAVVAPAVQAQSTLLQHPGRLLASGCFQCHGTNGLSGGFDALAGDGRTDLLNKLNSMRNKPAGSSIMVPHAAGYTNEQLWLIADYFSKVAKP